MATETVRENTPEFIRCPAILANKWETLQTSPLTALYELLVPCLPKEGDWDGSCKPITPNGGIIANTPRHKIEELHIITPDEYRILWELMVTQLRSGEVGHGELLIGPIRLCQWITVTSISTETYRTILCGILSSFILDLADWKCTIYSELQQLDNIMSYLIMGIDDSLHDKLTRKRYEIIPKEIVKIAKLLTSKILNILSNNKGLICQLGWSLTRGPFHNFFNLKLFANEIKTLQNAEKLLQQRRHVHFQARVMMMFFMDNEQLSNLQEYLHITPFGCSQYIIVYQGMLSVYTRGRKNTSSAQLRNGVYQIMRVLRVLPFVLQNKFVGAINDCVTVDENDPLLKMMLSIYAEDEFALNAESIIPNNWANREIYMSTETAKNFVKYPFGGTDEIFEIADHFDKIVYMESFTKDEKRRDYFETYFSRFEYCYIQPTIFYRIIFEDFKPTNGNKLHQGELLYALTHFLNCREPIRELFTEYKQRTCDYFCDCTNSLMEMGSLLLYYERLKFFMGGDESLVKKMNQALLDRQKIEENFVHYFFNEGPPELTYHIRVAASTHPYVFFFGFLKVFMFHTLRENNVGQEHCMTKLIDTVDFLPKLKKVLTTNKTTEDEYFHEHLYKQLTVSNKIAFVDRLKAICNKDWGGVLSSRGSLFFESFEENSLQNRLKRLANEDTCGQADVHLVRTDRFPMPVVAKYFRPQEHTSPQEIFLFMRQEIQTLLTMQCNPHIVSIYGYITEEHSIKGLIMEYCQGGALKEVILGSKGYTEDNIVWWTTQAACGINFLHRNNIMHRDVKPDNMLLDSDHYRLKISDLGITKAGVIATSGKIVYPYTSDRGTLGYTAPEVFEGDEEKFTKMVDVFGLGRSVWSMIYREVPEYTMKVAPTIVEISTVPQKVATNECVWCFVKRMMADNADDRPTMEEVYQFFHARNLISTAKDPIEARKDFLNRLVSSDPSLRPTEEEIRKFVAEK